VTFPTENIGLVESSLGYGGYLSAGFHLSGFGLSVSVFGAFGDTVATPVLSEQAAMNFVSVQQIPEPGTAALLVGGAAIGLRGRVRRGLGKLFKGKAGA